jgi:hypothetical protein
MPLDDEMPAAPGPQAAAAVPASEFSGDISTESYEKVPEMGEPLPIGTYHFRSEAFTTGWSAAPKPGDKDFAYGSQPYFMIRWMAQQEPHTGRVFMDFAPWVSDSVARAANAGDTEAQKVVNDRIWKLKAIAEAAGYKPPEGGSFNAKIFLQSNPEVKISLGQQERKQKDPKTGQYVGTGQRGNKANAYLPLFGAR